MRIADLRRTPTPSGAAVSARVTWEDVDRPEVDLSFATEAPFHESLEPRPAAFLTGAIWPAYHAGERRIAVEGTVCPRLREGLETVLRVLARWYPPARPFPAIEPTSGFAASRPVEPRRTAMFLSGGIDSLALLLDNRATVPADHPLRVRECLFVHGLDIGAPHARPRLAFYERVRRLLEPVAAAAGATVVPVHTNVRALEPDTVSWPTAWFGSGTVAAAHAFDAKFSDVLLAASLDVEGLVPAGSHPLLDPHLSSGALTVRHEGLGRSRLRKIRAVVDAPESRAALRVCWQDIDERGPLNCGRCRKCVRAMLGLLAIGRLEDVPTFPRHDLAPPDLDVCTVDSHTVRFYEEVLEPLEARGRSDLARVLRRRLEDHARPRPSVLRAPWRGLRRLFRRS